tara:strand:+ start:2257 stop:2583 length:327 start_codon:yes stop_codon:yes gene_type:complete
MLGFIDSLENDHQSMLNKEEFGSLCLNTRNAQEFTIIKTEAYIQIDGEGLPITSDKPMFNTSKKTIVNKLFVDLDIKQNDILTIDNINFRVFDIRNDGIGGIDIYLKG